MAAVVPYQERGRLDTLTVKSGAARYMEMEVRERKEGPEHAIVCDLCFVQRAIPRVTGNAAAFLFSLGRQPFPESDPLLQAVDGNQLRQLVGSVVR